MKLNIIVIGLSLLVVSGLVAAETVNYKIDPTHTATVFTWNHLGFSTPSANFSDIQGNIYVDNNRPAKSCVSVVIPVKSINTNVPKKKKKIQDRDWFDVAKYPNITFKSTKVETTDKKHFKILGNLTVKGITKPVILNAILNSQAQHPMAKVPAIGFNAATTIKRSDFGMADIIPAVSDTIEIQITTEALAAQ